MDEASSNSSGARNASVTVDKAAFPATSGGRIEDRRLLTGRGRYIDDLPVPRGTVHAAILRSPHGHARISAIDASAALALPGVVAVLTGRDIATVLGPFPNIVRSAPDYRAAAVDRVRYVGEPVAVVLALDRYRAEDGAALVDVDYDPLPAVIDPERATEPDAPQLHEGAPGNVAWSRRYRYGDPDAAFAEADLVVGAKLHFPKYNSTPMETYGVVAEYSAAEDRYRIDVNFQGPFSLFPVMARALRVPESRIQLRVPEDVGGSFGNKAMIYPYAALIAACARLSGRPVKWIEDRSEHLLGSASGTDRVTDVEAAVRRDGRILAVRVRMKENVGAYLRAPEPSCVMRSLTTFSGPYRIDHGDIDVACVMTNKLPTGLNRGYGGQQHFFTLERLVDRVADATGLDVVEVRRRNFIAADAFPHRTTTGSYYDSGDYAGCLDRVLALAGYDALRAEQARLRKEGRLIGIGLATAVHSAASNIGYVTLALTPEERGDPAYQHKSGTNDAAEMTLDPTGRTRVRIATAGAGQGHATTVAQVTARELGVTPDMVDVVDQIDTATTPWSITTGTYASRFAVAVVGAAARAGRALNARIRAAAAELLKASPEELELVDGYVRVKGQSNRGMSLKRLAGAMQWNRGAFADPAAVSLQVSESYGAPNLQPPDARDRVNAAATYGFMADLAVVEVDPETWIPRVVKYVGVHDVGRAINPQLLRGQITGGIVHGMAGALFEECQYDEQGQMLNASFMDYLCPTASEAPEMVFDHHDSPSPFTEYGAKGCGENSAMSGPPAIASAVEDALRPFGARIDQLPVTPADIWRLATQGDRAP